jgi:adenosyl cobinamide kinase/adenosyl cobinamide phosphate guanylyltransferase
VIVSNEVGDGVHPPTPLGRRFRDLLGSVNQRLAAAADRVTLMVAGIPVAVKDTPLPTSPDARPPEAP